MDLWQHHQQSIVGHHPAETLYDMFKKMASKILANAYPFAKFAKVFRYTVYNEQHNTQDKRKMTF